MSAIDETKLPRNASWSGIGNLLVVYLVWGSTYFAVKIAVTGPPAIAPLQLQTWRMWAASAVLIALGFIRTRRLPALSARQLAICAISGVLMWVMGNGLATLASRHAASGFIVMAMGMIPIWTTLIAGLADRTRPSRGVVAGLAIGLIGLSLIVGPPIVFAGSSSVESGYAVWLALVLCAAGLTWAIGSLIQKPLLAAMSPFWAGGLQTLAAAIVLTGVCWTSGTAIIPPADLAPFQLTAFFYLVIFGSAISLLAYITVMKIYPPAVASTFAYVNPLVGVALGWGLLGEKPGLFSLFGIALILVGVSVIMAASKRK
ncbi:EamA family transporter [Neorhizobium sp. NCHU2750]|uniref:EamA family transporter n=1 Tax=Neorhizobium sp. NCHU2750 TaxID=1825976 RepID=UPI000E70D01E|nr:permease [Neorhizobium sp. NCHU2750]